MSQSLDKLRAELAAEPPASVAQLPAPQLDALTALIAAAKKRQTQELESATQAGLDKLPLLLRPLVRKLFS